MGLITTAFWYAFPYVLASLIGFFVAETWNNRTSSRKPTSKSDHRSRESIDLSTQQTSKTDQNKNGHIQQAKLEACDPEDHDNKSDDDDAAFNLHEGSHIPFKMKFDYTTEEIVAKSRQFYEEMNDRRSVRFFSTKPVPLAAIENIVRTAGKLVNSF